MVHGPSHRVFFSGDTGLTAEYTLIGDRLGPFDLLMPQLGQAVEPVQVDSVWPWWCGVEQAHSAAAEPMTWPKAAGWPLD